MECFFLFHLGFVSRFEINEKTTECGKKGLANADKKDSFVPICHGVWKQRRKNNYFFGSSLEFPNFREIQKDFLTEMNFVILYFSFWKFEMPNFNHD